MADTAETEKVKTGLSEVRTLLLGAQILLGFQYRAAFEPHFQALPLLARSLSSAALVFLTASVACLIAPSPFHHVVARGQATVRMNAYTRRMALVALVPFALAIGLSITVALCLEFGLGPAAALGTGMTLVAALCWFGPALARHPKPSPERDEMVQLKDRIAEIYTEDRVVLPGVQALLGFQLSSYLTESFSHLPQAARAVSTASLFLLLLSMVLLMTPAPFHRLAERGEDTERFARIATRLVLASLPPLALGVAGDIYVVIAAVAGRTGGLALAIALACAVFMVALWFGVPLAARRKPR